MGAAIVHMIYFLFFQLSKLSILAAQPFESSCSSFRASNIGLKVNEANINIEMRPDKIRKVLGIYKYKCNSLRLVNGDLKFGQNYLIELMYSWYIINSKLYLLRFP